MAQTIVTLAQLDQHFVEVENYMGRGLPQFSGVVTMRTMEENGKKYAVVEGGETSYRVDLSQWNNQVFKRQARIEVMNCGEWTKGWTNYAMTLRQYIRYMEHNLRINLRDKLTTQVLNDNAFPYTFVEHREVFKMVDRSMPYMDMVVSAADASYKLLQSECK